TDDFNLALAALPYRNLRAQCLAVDDLEDVLLVALRHDRLLGNYQRILLVAGNETHAREHAGPQRGVGVLHQRTDHNGASVRVHQRVDREDPPFVSLARQRVEGDLERLANLDLAQVYLGNPEVDFEWIDRLEIDDVCPLFHVIADRHHPQPDDPGERGLEFHFCELGFCELQRRLGDPQVVFRFVLRLTGNEVALGKIGRAIEFRLRELQVRARLLRVGLVDRWIEPDKRGALGDALPLAEEDRADASRNFRPQGDGFVGAKATHRGDRLRQGHARDLDGLDNYRARRCPRGSADLRLRAGCGTVVRRRGR